MTPRPQPPFTERTTTANWTLRRAVGNALGYAPSPYYDWAYLDGDKWREYPAWDVDLNVAIELWEGIDAFQLRWAGNWNAAAPEYGISEWAEIPAEAICLAVIAYNAARPPTAEAK